MRWWCAGMFKQRPRDSVEKPSTEDVALVIGSTGPALLRILLLGDGSGAFWKVYGISRRPLSPWSAAVPLSPWSAAVQLSPWPAAVPPSVFHGNFDLTDAEDVARALKTLTGITHFYVAWESRRADEPAHEANWALSGFALNCPKRLQTVNKRTVGAILLDNGLPPCSHFGLTDAEDIAKPLTGIVHFHVARESRRTDAPSREANSAMLTDILSVFISNCPKRLQVCLQTTGKCTVFGAALLDTTLPPCSHLYLTHPEDIAKALKPLTDITHVFRSVLFNALSVLVPSCPKRFHVCLHNGPSSQNAGVPLTLGSTRTTRATLLDTLRLEDDLGGGELSNRESVREKTCAPSAGQWNSIEKVSHRIPASEKNCAPSVGKWNVIKKVIIILVIFSLISGVDSSSTGTSSMNSFCPKRDIVSYVMPQQRKACYLIEIPPAHGIHSKRAVPAPAHQPRETNIELGCTLAAHILLFLCCMAPWVSVENLVPQNGRVHKFLYFIRIEPLNMWRLTLLISINFYASMISYGIAYGVASNPHENTWLKDFTWQEFTVTIANSVYCLAYFLVLMLLMRRESRVFQEANMGRSWFCTITVTIVILVVHGVLCGLIQPSYFEEVFLFEKIAFACILMMYLLRWFKMEPTGPNVLFNLCAIVSGIMLLCVGEKNNWYKWGVVFTGLFCRSVELITWGIWFWIYEARNPLIVAEQVNGG